MAKPGLAKHAFASAAAKMKEKVQEEEKVVTYDMKTFEPQQICVIDSGGWSTKAGFAGEVMPRSIFPTIAGTSRNQAVTIGTGEKECYVGHECNSLRGRLDTVAPIRDGLVQDWEGMERLWSNTIFDDLCIQPDKNAFLLTESAIQPLVSKGAREKMTELFFEGFAAEGLYVAVNSVLSLYASGLTTGAVVDSGADLTLAVPIHEGYTLTRQVTTSKVGGGALTDYLVQMLGEKGYTFTTPDEVDIVTTIKEKMCFVSDDVQAPHVGATYSLPDGTELKLGNERFQTAEYLFDFGLKDGTSKPYKLITETEELIDSSVNDGISSLFYSSVTSCDPYLRPVLLNNLVMAGGTTLLEGTQYRLLKDIFTLYREAHPTENTAEVIREGAVRANQNRDISAWMGGSMFGMLSMFSHMLIQQAEYNDVGPSVIHTKCF
eukprot:TRINITY_DN5456_c0_g1_i1.p1 TRINITY_DN5456_c0_g1~~TRINITY_DN5456_c0_g1_i1.p1  ORF type:complete len:468 (+),score=187.03 TRINITY_DN5456_c0_g1_i1:108-1406(+)